MHHDVNTKLDEKMMYDLDETQHMYQYQRSLIDLKIVNPPV